MVQLAGCNFSRSPTLGHYWHRLGVYVDRVSNLQSADARRPRKTCDNGRHLRSRIGMQTSKGPTPPPLSDRARVPFLEMYVYKNAINFLLQTQLIAGVLDPRDRYATMAAILGLKSACKLLRVQPPTGLGYHFL